jgi:hypothetical protein
MTSPPLTLLIGSGAGYTRDRILPALKLAEKRQFGDLIQRYFECIL